MLFRNCGAYYTKGLAPVDVAMVTVSPMDSHGSFSFGLTNCCMQEMLDSAKRIVLEVNPTMPFVFGSEGDHINIADVDFVVESSEPIPTVKSPGATDLDRVIAGNIFPYLRDGITLQLGIGGMPNSLGALIADSDLKDLGMHTELMSDGYLKLYEAGKITNNRKELNRGKGVFSICNGSRALYDFLDRNIGILSAPMHYVNDPATVGQLDNFVSINGCIAADLYGQVCSESAGTRQISGTGGQLDFVTGAFRAKERPGLSRHDLHLRGQGRRGTLPHPAPLHRGRHHHHPPHPGAVYGHGIRRGQPHRSAHLAAGRGAHRSRPSRLPGRADPRRRGAAHLAQVQQAVKFPLLSCKPAGKPAGFCCFSAWIVLMFVIVTFL